ncbi:alpha/beta hydrolase [Salinisphaera orenii MK-B5]|uniref:Alpha/beta hydrolase n=1 Tax=Salinisphaera orenii MK-B5 TaxID=856730 RepID=A0A423PG73_9GAMM|nr:alpha/beta hydrolase [Salinisphaera orenii]ROO24533.1 alpha/beta hydrolase [Salinisphaera orenii MK-B5]
MARALVVSLVSGLLAACSGQFWANALTPRWGYDRHADIAYADGDRQRLDVYVPDRLAAGAPVVVFFYGGSWQDGDKAGYRFVGQALASRGFIAVLPDYRLYPPARFPAFVEDGARAVAWALEHAADYGGDPGHLFVAGHSAGAHIAAMLAADRRYLAAAGASVGDLAGLVGMAGPYDFLPIEDPVLQAIFAPRAAWARTQPIHFVTGEAPPMLLMHGAADRTVAPENSRNMASRVNDRGGEARLKIYPETTHVGLIAPLAAPLRLAGNQLDDITDFVTKVVSDRNR